MVCAILAFGNFVISGLAYRPSETPGKKPGKCLETDDCSFFGRVSGTVLIRYFRNSICKSKFLVEDLPRLIPRLRCCLRSETDSENFIKRTQVFFHDHNTYDSSINSSAHAGCKSSASVIL
ncbi:uncharacterized protein LOC144097922 [Amblyomma americanum]